MSNIRSAIAILLCLAGTAAAQPSAPFLEHRTVEALAADGIVLSRLGVTLEIQLTGDLAVVSLIDVTTDRAVASSRVEALPADREAAVATLTPAVANLVAQLVTTKAADADDEQRARLDRIEANQRALLARAEADRRETARIRAAELEYARLAVVVVGTEFADRTTDPPTRQRTWTAARGDGTELRREDFFRTIERDDLLRDYRRAAWTGYGAMLGGLVLASGGALLARTADDTADSRHKTGVALLIVGAAGAGLGALVLRGNEPLDEDEARAAVAAHNRKLRRRLRLPGGSAVTPLVGARAGGLSISGRF
jgi:hypothetical protein